MAALRGTVTGNRGEASRLGSAKSGLTTTAATWDGRVTVHLEADGACRVVVDNPRRGGKQTVVWEGNVDEEAAR